MFIFSVGWVRTIVQASKVGGVIFPMRLVTYGDKEIVAVMDISSAQGNIRL